MGGALPASTVRELEERLGRDRLERDVPLAPMTTFRIGGPADLLYRARTPDELAGAVRAARELEIPHFLLGAGANILVGDGGFRGLVIRNEVEGIEVFDSIPELQGEMRQDYALVVSGAVPALSPT